MISVTKLLLDQVAAGDAIRYGENVPEKHGMPGSTPPEAPTSAEARRPVVVWNLTRSCNLRCVHCYTDSEGKRYDGELSTEQAKGVIDDLADFGIPALLLSGGEPLTRHDFWELVPYARERGLRLTLSTNGTLIDEETARRLKDHGFTYVGISFDGIGEVNDRFRGKEGAFDAAVRGLRNCIAVGQRVGLRMTLTRNNYEDLDNIFDFIEAEGIGRVCFYHLVYSGRGGGLQESDLTHAETRDALDKIAARTLDMHQRGKPIEVLTVDNHIDGVYFYQRALESDPALAERIEKRLRWNGGGRNSSGVGIGDIDFLGNVHADQFSMNYSFGNVKERKFSDIWTDLSDERLYALRNQEGRIEGKCSACKWYGLCGGGMRVRAERVYGTPWRPDPACYLSAEECGISPEQERELREAGAWVDPPEYLTQGRA